MIYQPERMKWTLWMAAGVVVFLATELLAMGMLWPAAQINEPLWYDSARHVWMLPNHPRTGITPAWQAATVRYVQTLVGSNTGWWVDQIWWRFYTRPVKATGEPGLAFIVAQGISFLLTVLWLVANPFDSRPTALGGARWATWRDIVKDNLNGPTGFVLGRAPLFDTVGRESGGLWDWWDTFRTKLFGMTLVRWGETISGVMLAPPGTGKTVQLKGMILADWPDHIRTRFGFKTPTAFPGPSFLVNDPKGEIFRDTAAWRATIGPVFKLSWGDMSGHRWNPIGWGSLPGGKRLVELNRRIMGELSAMYDTVYRDELGMAHDLQTSGEALRGILDMIKEFDDWQSRLLSDPLVAIKPPDDDVLADTLERNVRTNATPARLSALFADIYEKAVLQAKLEKLVDQQMAILVPEGVEQHWKSTGRACGAGMTLFIIERSIHDPDTYGEPSYAKLLNWLSGVTKNGIGFAERRRRRATGETVIDSLTGESHDVHEDVIDTPDSDEGDGGDADADLTAKLLDAAIAEAIAKGFSARTIGELKEVRMKPDKERGSVVSTFAAGISIFKNAAVAARTSTCSFHLPDFRGMKYQGRDGQPITVYITISLEDAQFLGTVTGLLVECLANFLLSQDDEEVKNKRQRPVFFLLDEFWTLPPVISIKQIPALGRGLWAAVLVIGQSWRQIASKFKSDGQNVISEIKSAAPVRIQPTQTDEETAKAISESIGNHTVVQASVSRTLGLGKGVEPFQRNENEQWVSLPLARPEQVTSMEMFNPRLKKWGVQIIQVVGKMNRPLLLRPTVFFLDPVMAARAAMRSRFPDLNDVLYKTHTTLDGAATQLTSAGGAPRLAAPASGGKKPGMVGRLLRRRQAPTSAPASLARRFGGHQVAAFRDDDGGGE